MTVNDLARITDPEELRRLLVAEFPEISDEVHTKTQRGGRIAALQVLRKVKPQAYERSRNFLNGEVTRLSPYLRHGVLTLAEVRDFALVQVMRSDEAGKFISELGWRDYWQRLYVQLGDGIWKDREAYKTGFAASHYKNELPQALLEGTTSLACMDSFSRELHETGYLHNHARMWMAAYVVHWLGVRWQAGARWFLSHLLDGDPASNNLSWQWVASTFSNKAYIFNRENLERYSGGSFCRACVHARDGSCPFEASYEALSEELFPRLKDGMEMTASVRPAARVAQGVVKPSGSGLGSRSGNALIWVHTDGLDAGTAGFARFPGGASVFVWDAKWLREERISMKRVRYLAECLREMPVDVEIRKGDVAPEVLAAAESSGADYVVALRTPNPRLLAAAMRIEQRMPVVWIDVPPFVESAREFDLERFSRYWGKAERVAMQPTRR
jgi:deoxyribodipyrimidine photo-lyase